MPVLSFVSVSFDLLHGVLQCFYRGPGTLFAVKANLGDARPGLADVMTPGTRARDMSDWGGPDRPSGRGWTASYVPFLINASGSYRQGPFGYSGRWWLSGSLRATNRSCLEEQPAHPKISTLPQFRNHPSRLGWTRVLCPRRAGTRRVCAQGQGIVKPIVPRSASPRQFTPEAGGTRHGHDRMGKWRT